jgi:hypothetical protein
LNSPAVGGPANFTFPPAAPSKTRALFRSSSTSLSFSPLTANCTHQHIQARRASSIGSIGCNPDCDTPNDSSRRNSCQRKTLHLACFAVRKRTTLPYKPWSGGRDLNPQPSPWKSETLPLSYPRPVLLQIFPPPLLSPRPTKFLEPGTGIEPVTSSLPRTRSTN